MFKQTGFGIPGSIRCRYIHVPHNELDDTCYYEKLNIVLGNVQCTHLHRDVFIVDSRLNETKASFDGKVYLHVLILGIFPHFGSPPNIA